MRIPINLASEPFRRDRPMLAAGAATAIALIALLAVLIFLIVSDRSRMGDTRAEVTRFNNELRTLTAEQGRLETTLRQPANAIVTERNYLLNTMVERKSVSWGRVFHDLESVLPGSVRVIQVRLPNIDSRNQVQLDMVVGAANPAPVIDFLKRLEESPLFGPATVHNSAPPTDNEPLYRYRVSVSYAQQL